MKKFFKDYAELFKDSGRFYKEHWKGCIVLNAVIIGAEAAWFFREPIKDTVKEKLEKRKGEA